LLLLLDVPLLLLRQLLLVALLMLFLQFRRLFVLLVLTCALQLKLGCVVHACNSRCTTRCRLLAELLPLFCSVSPLMLRCINCHPCQLLLGEQNKQWRGSREQVSKEYQSPGALLQLWLQ
jgi:hypothetical protein